MNRFVKAAERSLTHGDGLDLLTADEFEEWFDLFSCGHGGAPMQREEFCMALCFFAAMRRVGGGVDK